jgi:hypothetical protein
VKFGTGTVTKGGLAPLPWINCRPSGLQFSFGFAIFSSGNPNPVDERSGIRNSHIEDLDGYGECQPIVQDILPEDIIDGTWERTIELMASRRGNDKDGRMYTIIITATDNMGNSTTKEIEIIVPHDRGN